MIEKRLFWVLLLISQLTYSQIKGVVKDSVSGKPIPYVSIWVENENIGTTSEEDGTFELNAKNNKKLLFSIVGYNSKNTILNGNNEVLLNPKSIKIEEVKINKLRKSKTLKVGISEFKRVSFLQGRTPQILAKKFEYDSIFKSTPYLKEVEVFTNSDIKNATFKLRILYVNDKTDLPIIDLVNEEIIVTVKKGRRKTMIDVQKYKIELPKNGIVIGLESMVIEKNKFNKSYSNQDLFAPSIICNYVEKQNTYMSLNLKWFKSASIYNERLEKNVVLEPAINIILTN